MDENGLIIVNDFDLEVVLRTYTTQKWHTMTYNDLQNLLLKGLIDIPTQSRNI